MDVRTNVRQSADCIALSASGSDKNEYRKLRTRKTASPKLTGLINHVNRTSDR